MADVPDLILNETLTAEWDAGAGLIFIVRMQTADEARRDAKPWRDVFSPDEVHQLAAWIKEHGLA